MVAGEDDGDGNGDFNRVYDGNSVIDEAGDVVKPFLLLLMVSATMMVAVTMATMMLMMVFIVAWMVDASMSQP